MKIVFMGTPDYAAEALRALIAAGHEITAVVTQPDKPKGRSKELVPSPVKVCALEHNIPVMQPKRIKTPEAIAQFSTPVTTFCMNQTLMANYGEIGINAFSVISYLSSFTMSVFFGASEGMQPLFGQAYGAKKVTISNIIIVQVR